MDLRDRGTSAHDRDAAATAQCDVLGGILRRHAAPEQVVVQARHGLARLPEAGDRGVFLGQLVDPNVLDARR